MRITKVMLEERLKNCEQARTELIQNNEILRGKLEFIFKLMPNASMIIAMEKMTEALAHTIDTIKRR